MTKWEEWGPCSVFASYALEFALLKPCDCTIVLKKRNRRNKTFK